MPTPDITTCGTCGRSWDDSVVTSMTPVPSGRCPFEAFHDGEPIPADWPVRPVRRGPSEADIAEACKRLQAEMESPAFAEALEAVVVVALPEEAEGVRRDCRDTAEKLTRMLGWPSYMTLGERTLLEQARETVWAIHNRTTKG